MNSASHIIPVMNTRSLLSSNPAPAQAETNAAQASAPKLIVHRDGRVSYRGFDGSWMRFVHHVPIEVFGAAEHRLRGRNYLASWSGECRIVWLQIGRKYSSK
jgi:hypothetical protein